MKTINSHKQLFTNLKIVQVCTLVLLLILFSTGSTSFYSFWVYFLIFTDIVIVVLDLTLFRKTLIACDEVLETAYLDDLTGMPNRFSCDLIFQMYGSAESISHVGCALIEIKNLIDINVTHGREAGNLAIIDLCNILEEIGKDYGFVGRNGGNEFLLIIKKCDKAMMDGFFEQLNTRLSRYNKLELNNPMEISYSYVLNNDFHATCFSDLITEVYRRVHFH